MASNRPEGLSPCYFSIASPDIPESHKFRWTFRAKSSTDIQTKFTINLMKDDYTVLKSYTQSSNSTEVDMNNIGYAMVPGTIYRWSVITYDKDNIASEESTKARFSYVNCELSPSISWTYEPKPGEVIVANTYFEEMKTNILNLIKDYEDVPDSLTQEVEQLFTNEVVPSKEDFTTLEQVIDYLSAQLENYYSVDIDGPVMNSLSASDLDVVRNHIDKLLTVPPKPVEKLSISVAEPTMYDILDLNSTHDGLKDPTIDLTWTVGKIPSYNGTFTFNNLSPSKDVRYYVCYFSYGSSNNPFISELYFRAEDMYDGVYRSFDTNWDGLYTASTIGLAKQSMQVLTYDHRGNASVPISVTKVYGSNFKAPLGVKQYEVEYQKTVMGDKNGPYPTGKWYDIYTGTNLRATHKISGGEGTYYYRVRAVDYSGLTTPWEYVEGITFDPLTAPASPTGFKCIAQTTTSLSFSWTASARAESYEFRAETNQGNLYAGTNRSYTATGLNSSATYDWFVRAKNRVGYSAWVSTKGTTKSARKTVETKSTSSKSWRNKGGWRNDTKKVYQGEWCNNWSTDHYIAGDGNTCYGKHKGMWLFDDNYWRGQLSGKDIIKVELYIDRQEEHNGSWGAVKPTIWLHNYDTFPSGQPSFFAKYTGSSSFSLGEGDWITLPDYYGEYIRDNKARGIGIYVDGWDQLPYIIFEPTAKLRITFE